MNKPKVTPTPSHSVNYVSRDSHYVKFCPVARELTKLFRQHSFKYHWANKTLCLRHAGFPCLNFKFSRNYVHIGRFNIDGKSLSNIDYALFAPTINVLIPKLVFFKILSAEEDKQLIA